ncbi:MAG TPA: type I restriction enzyme HsdR N-terminal domain-containing protein [Cyclobacteriaceae bacterium]|nr:type I restriction enzyme HsdR N-terminal domain-containing protein [Cyclobacteriaceae bacterium]
MMDSSHVFLKEPLNLPSYDVRIKELEGRLNIFDPLRKKFLVLTPEEWVRQHMINYLVSYKFYPRSLFSLEKGIKYNQLLKRFDILILDRNGSPFLLVECKAPEVPLTQKTAEQIAVYNKTVGAQYLALTNGRQHICLHNDPESGTYRQFRDFPEYQN